MEDRRPKQINCQCLMREELEVGSWKWEDDGRRKQISFEFWAFDILSTSAGSVTM